MRCVLCGRPLLNPATLAAGRPVGPKCAKRSGLLEPKREAHRRAIKLVAPPLLNPAQMLLFSEYVPSF